MKELQYPIGPFQIPSSINKEQIISWIKAIKELPSQLQEAIDSLNDEQLQTPYRLGGWTVWQLVHHIVDSHMNAYIRFKLALTEDKPTIKPYAEADWAELEDTHNTPIQVSLDMLKSLHTRWVNLLNTLDENQLSREYIHPEFDTPLRVDQTIAIYDWHSRHHLEHILALKRRNQW